MCVFFQSAGSIVVALASAGSTRGKDVARRTAPEIRRLGTLDNVHLVSRGRCGDPDAGGAQVSALRAQGGHVEDRGIVNVYTMI